MRKLITLLILLIVCAPAAAQVSRIERIVNGRVIVLTVKRETAERLKRHRVTEADRKELSEALDWALGRSTPRRVSCITGVAELPHADVERWVRCPVQNITRP